MRDASIDILGLTVKKWHDALDILHDAMDDAVLDFLDSNDTERDFMRRIETGASEINETLRLLDRLHCDISNYCTELDEARQ